ARPACSTTAQPRPRRPKQRPRTPALEVTAAPPRSSTPASAPPPGGCPRPGGRGHPPGGGSRRRTASMRGRKASAAHAVDRAAGSATAKQRAKAIYQVLSGQCSIAQACAALGVSEPRFHQLKEQLVQDSAAALEPRPGG